MNEHPTRAEFEHFVLDALEPDRRVEVADHVRDCPSCSEALIAAARLEVLAWEVARLPKPARPMRRRLVALLALGALAAAGVFAIRVRTEDPASTRADAVAIESHQGDFVVCIDAACVDTAFQSGLAPQAPTLLVPRYELMFRSAP